MKYAKEVIDLLGAYPGREFRMVQIVRHITNGRSLNQTEQRSIRKGIARAMGALMDNGSVTVRTSVNGSPSWYAWKARHEEVANC